MVEAAAHCNNREYNLTRRHRLRERRRQSTRLKTKTKASTLAGSIVLFIACLYPSLCIYFLWRTQSLTVVRRSESHNTNRAASQQIVASPLPVTDDGNVVQEARKEAAAPNKFLIFESNLGGQGAGNIIAGLLAAHLFGVEFNRIVCVSPGYTAFHQAFEPIHPWAQEKCPAILKNLSKYERNSRQIVNYRGAPDECDLKDWLASDAAVLFLTANTYPRWPVIPDNFFFQYYRAKNALIEMLPYDARNSPPRTVVHLREPDNVRSDFRKGLDEASLNALGRLLPRDTYLVTNRVAWYDKFEKDFGWSHPNWHGVVHSATSKTWGVRGQAKAAVAANNNSTRKYNDKTLQNMQLWCDWYSILTAKKVYHTHSDFSISAIHWMNIDSKTILDYDAVLGQLNMTDESWRVEGETARLVDRTIDGEGTSALRLCKSAAEKAALRRRSKH